MNKQVQVDSPDSGAVMSGASTKALLPSGSVFELAELRAYVGSGDLDLPIRATARVPCCEFDGSRVVAPNRYLGDRLGADVQHDLRQRLTTRLVGLDAAWHGRASSPRRLQVMVSRVPASLAEPQPNPGFQQPSPL